MPVAKLPETQMVSFHEQDTSSVFLFVTHLHFSGFLAWFVLLLVNATLQQRLNVLPAILQ